MGCPFICWNLVKHWEVDSVEESSTGAKESMPSSGNDQFDSESLCGLMLNLYGTRGGADIEDPVLVVSSEALRTKKSSKIGMSKRGKTSPSSLQNSDLRILLLVLRRWILGGVVIK